MQSTPLFTDKGIFIHLIYSGEFIPRIGRGTEIIIMGTRRGLRAGGLFVHDGIANETQTMSIENIDSGSKLSTLPMLCNGLNSDSLSGQVMSVNYLQV